MTLHRYLTSMEFVLFNYSLHFLMRAEIGYLCLKVTHSWKCVSPVLVVI